MTSGRLPAKRAVDVVLATLILVLGLPVWAALALLIRLTSPGPALYRGRRIGKDGQPFVMYKFRSMREGADRAGPGITGAGDPRVTPIGRVLRASKLDELPQLLNVLRGEMSLVGPRPEAPEYVALYDERQRGVLAMRPGITGPTQLLYRDEERLLAGENAEERYVREIMPRKLEKDLDYIRTQSLSGDLKLLAATIGRVLRR